MFRSLYQKLPSLSSLTSFSWWAKVSTGRSTIFKGLLPPITTVLSLALVSSAIALGAWFWLVFLATSVNMLPVFVTTAAAISGFTFLNFWFSRAINFAILSAREAREGFGLDEHNPTDLIKLVDHVLAEVNTHLKTNIPRPRICTFTDNHFKIITVEGRNPGKAALFFSSGCFNSEVTHINQRHLAALISFELYKIAQYRGAARTFVQMWTDMLSTLENARSGNLFSKMLGILVGPLQFFLLLQRSVSRSYEYEAGEAVFKMGRGMDLVDAIDFKVCGPLFKKGTYLELQENQAKHKRQEPLNYKGSFAGFINAFANWIDNNEAPGDDKTGWRFLSFLEICVQELITYVNELFSDKPRSTRLKDHLRPLLGLDVARTPDLPGLYRKDIATNQELYEKIIQPKPNPNSKPGEPANIQLVPYEPIAPQGNGYVAPVRFDHPADRAAKQQEKERNNARMNTLEGLTQELRSELAAQKSLLEEQKRVIAEQKQQLQLLSFQHAPSNGHGNGHSHDHDHDLSPSNGTKPTGSPPSSPTKKKVASLRTALGVIVVPSVADIAGPNVTDVIARPEPAESTVRGATLLSV